MVCARASLKIIMFRFFFIFLFLLSVYIEEIKADIIKVPQTTMKIVGSTEDKDYEDLVEKILIEASEISKLPKVSNYCLKAIDSQGTMIGGLAGYEFYGSFYIDVLWIDPAYRKKGIGSQLLQQIEKESRNKGLLFLSVSTMEWWDAKNFYEKNGFELEFVRKGFANGYNQYHLRKNIHVEERDET